MRTVKEKDFIPSENIPEEWSHILPVCPCGCESKLPKYYGEKELVRDCPSYVDEWPDKKASWLEIERQIIRSQEFVDSELVHLLRHLKLMMPWVCHDPNLVRMYEQSIYADSMSRKIHAIMGNASSGKTNYLAIRAFQAIDIFPDNSEAFVASPYQNAGEYLLWRQFVNIFDSLKDNGYEIYKDKSNVISLRQGVSAGVGTISFVSLHKDGKLRGKKMVDKHKGHLVVCLDEIGEFQSSSIINILVNLKSQNGLRVYAGTNFKDIHGIDGAFLEPQDKSWNDLDRELDYEWKAINGGWATRLRAKVSPNIAMGYDYYPYLLDEKGHDELLEYGVDSQHYLTQADSFVSVELTSRVLITLADIKGAGCYNDVLLEHDRRESFGFCDPAFTHKGDNMVFTAGVLGYEDWSRYKKEGDQRRLRITNQKGILVPVALIWETKDIEYAKTLRRGRSLKENVTEGSDMSPYDFCAIESARYCDKHGISYNNFGFDDSLSGRLTASMKYFMGEGVREYGYGGSPDKRNAFPLRYKYEKVMGRSVKKPMLNSDKHNKMVSQMWFTTTELLRNGYIKNVFECEVAIDEICKRLKENKPTSNKKEDVESKSSYKGRNRGKSPDYCDSLCGLANMVTELRMTPVADSSEASGRLDMNMYDNLFQILDEEDGEPIIQPLSR